MATKAPAKRKRRARPRALHDWYVEPKFADELLERFLRPMLVKRWWRAASPVWDPACGKGTVLDAFWEAGHSVSGTDIIDRFSWHFADRQDFLQTRSCPDEPFDYPAAWSIITNPPYKLTEAFVRHALTLAGRFVAVLVPLNFTCSAKRHAFFYDLPPRWIAYLSERPSMPPGNKIAEMGDAAFKGGAIDYCWIIWDVRWLRRRKLMQRLWGLFGQRLQNRTRVLWFKRAECAA